MSETEKTAQGGAHTPYAVDRGGAVRFEFFSRVFVILPRHGKKGTAFCTNHPFG